jgi:hypothetical protein
MTSRPPASLVILVALALGACSSSASLGGKPAKPVRQEKPEVETPKQEDAQVTSDEQQKDEALDDEDLKVIPPEVVSGAYLTCPKTIEPTLNDDQTISFGCTAETSGGRIDLEGFKKDWQIFKVLKGGSERLPLEPSVTERDATIDIDWSLSAAQFRAGVFARVILHGKNGTTATLDSKHPSIVNGVARYD